MVLVVPATTAVTVIVSAVSTPDETAQYSYNIPPVLETLVRRLHDKLFASVTVGGLSVGVIVEVKNRIITSFMVPVVRATVQNGVQAPWYLALPSNASEVACAAGMEAPNRMANAKVAINARLRTRLAPPDVAYFPPVRSPA